MNVERLKKLADFLRVVDPAHFDLDSYTRDRNGTDPITCAEDLHRCGSTACAIGYCPVIFPDDWQFDSSGLPELKGRLLDGIDGAVKYFGLETEDAWNLFMPSRYCGYCASTKVLPSEVADRIDELISRS